MTLEGGCLCGAVRYRVDGQPFDAGYCHCSMCRKASGAPVVAWASARQADFEFTAGEPRRFRSSERVERAYCGGCGAQLLFDNLAEPQTIDFAIATLDDPDAVAPTFHIYDANRIAWFETQDDLPRHKAGRTKN